jgi:methionine aminopeptidase
MPNPMVTVWCGNWWGTAWAGNSTKRPEVPNYGRRGHGVRLRSGMALAIEPMINMGVKEVKQMSDGWTVVPATESPAPTSNTT